MGKQPKPRRIVMLAFEGAQVLDITGPLQMFAAANVGLKTPVYDIVIATRKAGAFGTSSGALRLMADASFTAPGVLRNLDTLMVSGGDGVDAAIRDGALLKAIHAGARSARRVSSVCSGSLALAAAGLLDGKRAATHWSRVDQLAAYPGVKVESDAIYVRDGRIWTSAGVTAGMDLALAMIREDHGDQLALAIARQHVMFLIRPGGQSQFSAHLNPDAYPTGRLAASCAGFPNMSAKTSTSLRSPVPRR